jgi:hypothetical protein
MAFTHKTDLAVVAQGRIVSQYRNSPLFVALIGAIAGVIQTVEDAFWDLYSAMLLDSATGVWLEYLGAIVGEAREGWGDTDYRRLIKARILINKSSGTIDEVLTIAALILDVSVTTVFLRAEEFYPASMLLEIVHTVHPPAALRNRLCRMVARARPVGVRLLINSVPNDSNTFTLGDSDVAQPQLDINLGFSDTASPTDGGMFASGDLA